MTSLDPKSPKSQQV